MTRVRAPDGGPLDVTDPAQATWGELEGRRLAEEAAAFVIEHVPGFAEAFLADTAPVLGVRESRRSVGRHVLTGEEVSRLARFDDAVAAGAWPREYHVTGRSTSYEALPPGGYYQVPLRSLRWPASTTCSRPVGAPRPTTTRWRHCASWHHPWRSAKLRGSRRGMPPGATSVPADVQAELREQGAFIG